MKAWKHVLSFGVSAVMMAAAPLSALASSPEFARTEEEWAKLRDNVIEYGELADLIHEYNATVLKNQIDMNEFRREYGDTNDKVANRYRELADEIENNISYPDIDDTGYASIMSGIISQERQIDQLREQADNAVEDSTTQRFNYALAEATLVSVAQNNMISYYLNQTQLEIDQKKKELLQENYQSALVRRSAGMGTDAEILTAQENLRSAEQAVQQDESNIENLRQKLLVMLGWKHDDDPQIQEIPAVDMDRIAAMNPAEDKARALENNYTLNVNRRKLENARSSDAAETLQKTIAENEQSIGAALTADYQNVLANKTAYDLAVAQGELEQKNFEAVARKYQLGNASRIEYLTQKNTTETARLNVRAAELNLFQAVQAYDWAVNGLAATS